VSVYQVAARELLRNTLLDAARELLAERSWSQVTMAEVARAAGVSRQTVYNEFGSRADFAQALVMREADELLADVEAAVRGNPADAAAALTAALEVFLRAAADDPLVRAIVAGGDEDSLLPFVTTRGGPVVEYGVDRLAGVITDVWDTLGAEDSRALADCLVRLGISYAALPAGSPRRTAAAVARVLGPCIDGLTGRPADR
jgi:AcrR family transcriptional regulator